MKDYKEWMEHFYSGHIQAMSMLPNNWKLLHKKYMLFAPRGDRIVKKTVTEVLKTLPEVIQITKFELVGPTVWYKYGLGCSIGG